MWEHAVCEDEGQYIGLYCTNALCHLLLMLKKTRMRERKVVYSTVAQGFVYLRHQCNEYVVECAGREFLVCLPNCLDESFNVFCKNFLLKAVKSVEQTKLVNV